MKIWKISGIYLYHGTSEGAFRRIRMEGLMPTMDNIPIYFSNTETYAESYAQRKGNPYGNRILRVIKTEDMISDDRTNHKGDFKTMKSILPEHIEVKVDGVWMPITNYKDKGIGII